MSQSSPSVLNYGGPKVVGCPDCGAPLKGIETRGPGDIRARPCGHHIGFLTARELLGGDQQ